MLCMTLCVASIFGYYFRDDMVQILISAFAVILFGVYLVYDTQLIIGDKDREISIDDYIIGAMMLYIDIIRIFIELLKILSIVKNNRNN